MSTSSEREIEGGRVQALERLPAVRRRVDAVAVLLEQAGQQPPVHGVVVDDEDPCGRSPFTAAPPQAAP